MERGRPLISIVMAVYQPKKEWLCELLDSLNAQTYQPLELLIYDDCPKAPVCEKIFVEHITAFPYKIFRNKKNEGSNKVFEYLTEIASGEYISYCDQDDIWIPTKIAELYKIITEKQAELVYSDVIAINSTGTIIAKGMKKLRRNYVFQHGGNLFGELLTHNFVTGCTMLVRAETAKAAVPFMEEMYHDHWIALFASCIGTIEYSKNQLVYYRIHGGNQTGLLKNVNTKSEYISERIEKFITRMERVKERFENCSETERVLCWAIARKEFVKREKNSFVKMWTLKKVNWKITLFELATLRLPESLFGVVLKASKKLLVTK